MDIGNLPYDRHLTERAQALRREMTPQERKLWYQFLRQYPVKVYRQRVIDHFIADFYCAKAKLVIELDGSQHYTEQGKCRMQNALQFWKLMACRYYASRIGISEFISRVYA